jgi:hypothetical protein
MLATFFPILRGSSLSNELGPTWSGPQRVTVGKRNLGVGRHFQVTDCNGTFPRDLDKFWRFTAQVGVVTSRQRLLPVRLLRLV